MARHLIALDHCRFILDKQEKPTDRFRSMGSNDVIIINTSIYGELHLMVELSEFRKPNFEALQRFLQNISILNIDEDSAENYAKIKARLFRKYAPKEKQQRRRFKLPDAVSIKDVTLWTVATAINYRAIILSSDSEFRIIQEIPIKFNLESWQT